MAETPIMRRIMVAPTVRMPLCDAASRVFPAARRLVLFAAIWIILTGGEALLLGAPAVSAACWFSFRLLPPVRPLRLSRVIAMGPGFLRRSLLGGLDVARRALTPRMPLNPGWIGVDVDLPEGGRVALGGELSLMPGTLVAGSDGRRLLVHVLDRDQDVERMVRQEASRLGRALATGKRGDA